MIYVCYKVRFLIALLSLLTLIAVFMNWCDIPALGINVWTWSIHFDLHHLLNLDLMLLLVDINVLVKIFVYLIYNRHLRLRRQV